MHNDIFKYIQGSCYARHFIIVLTVAISLVFTASFSFLILLALLLSAVPDVVNLKVFENKLEYDQKQQLITTPLLFSSVLWALYMWQNLQDAPYFYSFVFVSIAASAFINFNQLKVKLFIVTPVLFVFLILLVFINDNNLSVFSVFVLAICLLFLFSQSHKNANKKTKKPSEEREKRKMELVYELDSVKVECKKHQDKLKQMEIDLSAAEMAKMEFLATMSHEIRTPLNGIIPLLDILLDSEMSDFQKDYLSTAHVSAIQMQKLIDDLLDYSKVEAGKLTVEVRGLKIPRILAAVKASYRQAAEKKRIEIKVEISKNISPLLRGDPTRLRQVLSNLVSNAIKFSSGGMVSIKAKKIKDFPNKEIIRFKVVDQGIGLDKETSDNIFLAFTQEDGSSTRKFGGTGLGLAISKKIVELMHGNIGVESEKGRGSTFYFDLPLLKSMGETSSGIEESSGFQAILVNTNPLLFNKVAKSLQTEKVPFQKALGLSQAYEIYAAINKVSKQPKNTLIFIDFETAGKHVRGLCNDLSNDSSMENLYACILSENKNIAGIPRQHNIKFLTKGHTISELLDNISVAQASLGVSDQESPSLDPTNKDSSPPPVSETSQADPTKVSGLVPEVLLVEDNEINLKVAEKLIQYIGYPFDFAMNGQEALDKVKQTRYRMILMDCLMPVMDGYRCTRKIRDYEAAAGLNHTPILAMTANAMMGDREKCLDAGMDDYMSKPLNRYILEKTLKKWDPLANNKSAELPTQPAKTSSDESKTETNTGKEATIDQKTTEQSPPKDPKDLINQKWLSTKILAGLEEIMGEEIVQLLNMFEQETPNIIKEIQAALNKGDFDSVKKMAHMLKSTSSNIGANGLSFFSRKLELAAVNNDKGQLVVIYEKIKKSYLLTKKEISKYLNS